MIVCNHCGAKNQDSAKICMVCGKPIQGKEKYTGVDNTPIPWYKKNWFVILMLIFLYPVGVILMWVNKNFKFATRIIFSIIFGIFFIYVIFSNPNTSINSSNESSGGNEHMTIVNEMTTEINSNDSIQESKKEETKQNIIIQEAKKEGIKQKNGWIEENGDWHYYVKGKLQKSKFVENEYYVDEYGNMLKNVITKIDGKRYRFDGNGNFEEIEDLELVGGINNTKARYDGYFASYISGTVVNNTDKEYSYVQITFKLYDSSGAKVGNAIANTNDLEPGERWKFEAIAMTDFETYKLDEITGW